MNRHTYAGAKSRKRPRSSMSLSPSDNRRIDWVLVSLAAMIALQIFLALTHFAPLHFLARRLRRGMRRTSAQCRRSGLSRCARPRILYPSSQMWGKDDYFERPVDKTVQFGSYNYLNELKAALKEERKTLELVSRTALGVQESNLLTRPRVEPREKEDAPTVRVILGRRLQDGLMSEFDPETCCHHYDHPYYRDVGENCELMAPEWQLAHRPTCNSIHEISLDEGANGLHRATEAERITEADNLSMWLADGDYRDVWVFAEANGLPRVLKTLVYRQLQTRPKILRMFRDEAAAMDHLHQSPYVATVLGVCGVSQVQDFSLQGGFKPPAKDGKFTSLEVLKVATQVARAVSDVHDYNKENGGKATMAVADVSSGQFVYNDRTQTFLLQDMNLIKMLKRERTNGNTCQFQSAPSAGSVRSPEEYSKTDHTEYVDVWALGNVIHFLMRGEYAWCDQDLSECEYTMYNVSPLIDYNVQPISYLIFFAPPHPSDSYPPATRPSQNKKKCY
jgi:hypothetical protein